MGVVHAKSLDRKGPKDLSEVPYLPFVPHEGDIPTKKVDFDNVDPNSKDVTIDGVKARVDKVHIDGLKRTKNDYVDDCFDELFQANTFQDVLLKTHKCRVKLEELGVFKNIAVFIDTSKGLGSTADGLEITFNVQEYKRLTGGVSTHVGNNEGGLLVGLRAPNLFGRGEKIQTEYSHGSKNSTNFMVSLIKPFKGKRKPVATASIFQSNMIVPTSGYKEVGKGILLDFGFKSQESIKHNIQWEGVIREIGALGKSTSFEVREKSGASLKSALRHIVSADFRDDVIFPTGGTFLKNSTEFAGLGGDIGFLRNDVYLQTNCSLIDDFVLQGCLGFGFVRGLSNDMKIGISDMFFLGGPSTIRGFQTSGIGPHSDGDAIGGFGYWGTGLHLFTPLPFRPGRGGLGELFRTHFFVNAGNVVDFNEDSKPLSEILSENLRLSYGLGIALRLGNLARIELNYCFPHKYYDDDQCQHGVQFGIGVQFL